MNNENLNYKLNRTQREESYLWKTTHLNTAKKTIEGGMKGEGGRRDRRGKRRKTEAEHEKKGATGVSATNKIKCTCLSLRQLRFT